jgi:hypothetical protein
LKKDFFDWLIFTWPVGYGYGEKWLRNSQTSGFVHRHKKERYSEDGGEETGRDLDLKKKENFKLFFRRQ